VKFKIDKMWPKRSFIQRWASKIVAKMFLDKNSSYQCCGEVNWTIGKEKRADIQVPASQFAHWILREAGYSVCEADLWKYLKEVPEDGKGL
jgi:hypothetical protein